MSDDFEKWWQESSYAYACNNPHDSHEAAYDQGWADAIESMKPPDNRCTCWRCIGLSEDPYAEEKGVESDYLSEGPDMNEEGDK